MTLRTSPESLYDLRKRLRELIETGTLPLFAKLARMEEDKITGFAYTMSYMPLSSELQSMYELLGSMERSVKVTLAGSAIDLTLDNGCEECNPYNRRGRLVK